MDSIGVRNREILAAVAAGKVVRDDQDGARRGMWALYRLDDDEVGLVVRWLARAGLVSKPLLGPPSVTEDGATLLRESHRLPPR